MGRRHAVVLLCAAVLGGCGSSGGDAQRAEPTPTLEEARRDLRGAPDALAKLHARANEVLPSDPKAFARRLEGLRGYPVVVNKWASWCSPCILEFPVFQRVSAELGDRVAFVGLNSRDDRPAAERFLKDNPVSYPSFFDSDDEIARSIRAPQYQPITNFYDRRGKLVFQHSGPYENDADLERDLRRYVL